MTGPEMAMIAATWLERRIADPDGPPPVDVLCPIANEGRDWVLVMLVNTLDAWSRSVVQLEQACGTGDLAGIVKELRTDAELQAIVEDGKH